MAISRGTHGHYMIGYKCDNKKTAVVRNIMFVPEEEFPQLGPVIVLNIGLNFKLTLTVLPTIYNIT